MTVIKTTDKLVALEKKFKNYNEMKLKLAIGYYLQ